MKAPEALVAAALGLAAAFALNAIATHDSKDCFAASKAPRPAAGPALALPCAAGPAVPQWGCP